MIDKATERPIEGALERRMFSGLVQLRAAEGEKAAVISGLAVVIGKRSENFGSSEYPIYEQIDPGALDSTDISDVRALFNHDPDNLLGRTTSKTLRLTRASDGLHFECDPPDTQMANDLREMIQRGDVTGCSFAFTVKRGGTSWDELPEGGVLRRIRAIDRIYDVGPVTFPAYPATDAEARGLETVRSEAALYVAERRLAKIEERDAAHAREREESLARLRMVEADSLLNSIVRGAR